MDVEGGICNPHSLSLCLSVSLSFLDYCSFWHLCGILEATLIRVCPTSYNLNLFTSMSGQGEDLNVPASSRIPYGVLGP